MYPGLQCVQATEPSALKRPAGQAEHRSLLVLPANFPASHAEHPELAAELYLPLGQSEHAVLPLLLP